MLSFFDDCAALMDSTESSSSAAVAAALKAMIMQRCLLNLENNASAAQSLLLLQVTVLHACVCLFVLSLTELHVMHVMHFMPWLESNWFEELIASFGFLFAQRVIQTHAKDSKAWFGRDKNTVAVVLEGLQNKPVRSPKLFDLFFNNLMVRNIA